MAIRAQLLPLSVLEVLFFLPQLYAFPVCWLEVHRGSLTYLEPTIVHSANATTESKSKIVEDKCIELAVQTLRTLLTSYAEHVGADETAIADARAQFIIDLYVDYPRWGILNDHHLRIDGCGVDRAHDLTFSRIQRSINLQKCIPQWEKAHRQQELSSIFETVPVPASAASERPNCEVSLRSRMAPIRRDNYLLFTRKLFIEGTDSERARSCSTIGGNFMDAFLEHFCHGNRFSSLCEDLKTNYFVEAVAAIPRWNKANDEFIFIDGCTASATRSIPPIAACPLDLQNLIATDIVMILNNVRKHLF